MFRIDSLLKKYAACRLVGRAGIPILSNASPSAVDDSPFALPFSPKEEHRRHTSKLLVLVGTLHLGQHHHHY